MAPDRCEQDCQPNEDSFAHYPFTNAAEKEPAYDIGIMSHAGTTQRLGGIAKRPSLHCKDERYDSEPAYARSGLTYAVAQPAQPERSGARNGVLCKEGGKDSLSSSGKDTTSSWGHGAKAGVKGVKGQGTRKKKAVALSENDVDTGSTYGRRDEIHAARGHWQHESANAQQAKPVHTDLQFFYDQRLEEDSEEGEDNEVSQLLPHCHWAHQSIDNSNGGSGKHGYQQRRQVQQGYLQVEHQQPQEPLEQPVSERFGRWQQNLTGCVSNASQVTSASQRQQQKQLQQHQQEQHWDITHRYNESEHRQPRQQQQQQWRQEVQVDGPSIRGSPWCIPSLDPPASGTSPSNLKAAATAPRSTGQGARMQGSPNLNAANSRGSLAAAGGGGGGSVGAAQRSARVSRAITRSISQPTTSLDSSCRNVQGMMGQRRLSPSHSTTITSSTGDESLPSVSSNGSSASFCRSTDLSPYSVFPPPLLPPTQPHSQRQQGSAGMISGGRKKALRSPLLSSNDHMTPPQAPLPAGPAGEAYKVAACVAGVNDLYPSGPPCQPSPEEEQGAAAADVMFRRPATGTGTRREGGKVCSAVARRAFSHVPSLEIPWTSTLTPRTPPTLVAVGLPEREEGQAAAPHRAAAVHATGTSNRGATAYGTMGLQQYTTDCQKDADGHRGVPQAAGHPSGVYQSQCAERRLAQPVRIIRNPQVGGIKY